MEDRNILTLLLHRSEQAIAALAERFGKRLYATAMNILSSTADAEECVNDTYLAIWNAIPPQQPDSLTTYVLRTGRNIAINRLRDNTAQKRSAYTVCLDELEGCIPAPRLEDGHLLGQAMNQWLSEQKKDTRVIFLRRYWFGDCVKDIARNLGMTENAVSVRLNRTKESLKTFLTKEGYYE